MNVLIIVAAQYLYLIILLIAGGVFVVSSRQIKQQLIVLGTIVLPACFILAKLLGSVIISPRPFIVEHITPLVHGSMDNGFPSDHMLLSMSVAAVIFAYNRKIGSLLFVLAVCVGIGRVLAKVHHPIDILGSIGIAVVVTVVAYRYVVPQIPKKMLSQIPYFKD
jgi:undecaprenyl-diphosphatase